MTDRAALVPLVEALSGARVLCVGDLMLDRYVHGEVERISPEAPIPVLRVTGESAMLGGAGNMVRNLAALGGRVRFIAVVGDDPPLVVFVNLGLFTPGCWRPPTESQSPLTVRYGSGTDLR